MARTTTRSARTREADEDRYASEEDFAADNYSRRRGLGDEDADPDDRGRRTVSRRRAADEDERPARRSTTTRSRSRDEDSGRRSADGDPEGYGDPPRRESGRSTSIGRGREGLRRHRETHSSGGNFPVRLKVDKDEEVLVKFLDDDFLITYYEHEFFKDFEGEKRQKTFICLGPADPEHGVPYNCPLCDIGDEPKFYALINVVDLRNPRKPELKLWYATPNPGGLIEDEMDSLEEREKKINDPSFYYVVSKKRKSNNFYEYSLKLVKARDLEEDGYGEPLDQRELDEFADRAWTEDVVRIDTRKKLLEIADELPA